MKPENRKSTFLDFFCGSGLVCEGLKPFFYPVWANDICPRKAAVFTANHPKGILQLGPIEDVRGAELPEATLSWASFPCQDLSLAGNMGGISSERSGLVWHWLRVMDEMAQRPPIAVAENVLGLVSAAKGAHYRRLHEALVKRGYRVGAVMLDAVHWVPQSRKRVFVVAVDSCLDTSHLESSFPEWCHPLSVQRAAKGLRDWVWWRIPLPPKRTTTLESIVDMEAPIDDDERKSSLVGLVPKKHMKLLEAAHEAGRTIFPGYKRVRNGQQVLELRFDGVAGCLRTPQGGSSRQFLLIRQNGSIGTRLLTVRETAALMGARPDYKIPGSYNDGYRAMGDAVAVPVVEFLGRTLLSALTITAAEKQHEHS